MSQAGLVAITGGVLPPAVPLQFTTDSGVAVPAANNLNVLASDTTANDDDGITTTGAGSTVTVLLTNRATGTVTTTDATPTPALTFALGATPGVFFFEGNIVAFDATDTAGGAYSFVTGMRTTGGAATEIGTEFKDSLEEAAMATADFNIIAVLNTLNVVVVGIAAKTIRWNVSLTYRFVS